MSAIRASWEVAALAQFYRTLGPALELPYRPTIDQLESDLIDGTEEVLLGLLPPLLGLDEDADSGACWREVAALFESGEAVLDKSETPESFGALTPVERGQLLFAIADASLSLLERGPHLDDPSSARGERVGSDSKGGVYWDLGDHRIYRQSAPKKRKGGGGQETTGWEVSARSGAEWRALIGSLTKKKGVEVMLRSELEERVVAIEAHEAKVSAASFLPACMRRHA